MTTHTSNRWKEIAWYAVVVVVVLIVWRLGVRLIELARERWAARRAK